MRLLVKLPLVFLAAYVGACGEQSRLDLEDRREVSSEEYFQPDCWGGMHLTEAPLDVPVVLAIERRETVAYVSVLSPTCDVNRLGIPEFGELPTMLRLEDSASHFRIEKWVLADDKDLAAKLRVQKVFPPPVHGPIFTEQLQLYTADLEIKAAQIRGGTQVSDFEIGGISRLRKLERPNWRDSGD